MNISKITGNFNEEYHVAIDDQRDNGLKILNIIFMKPTIFFKNKYLASDI